MERYFAGINFTPRKLPENAQTPTSRVHALLGAFDLHSTCCQKIIETNIENPKRHTQIRKMVGNGLKLFSSSVAHCLVRS
jgi:hypothetical protein